MWSESPPLSTPMHANWYAYFGKRCLDIILSTLGLFLLSPIIFIVSFLVVVSSPGPVFFVQERVGQHFKSFKLYKFRTMVTDAAQVGLSVTVKGDVRITPLGRFLRKTKLDELPQLWNVVKGDMSLVGPRPEVKKYVEKFLKEYQVILEIKPGITDKAAIEFRCEESILSQYNDVEKAYIQHVLPQKIKLYHQYRSNLSLTQDLFLIFKTVYSIFS